MLDFVYVLVTIVIFALMVNYGYGCRRLGHDSSADTPES